MELLVRNAEGNLTEKDREYAAKKLGKLDRYFHDAQRVEIVHRQERSQHKPAHRIEVTVHADGLFLRGEECDVSIAAAIDKVADKMENRLRRLKSKIVQAHKKRGQRAPDGFDSVTEPEEDHVNGVVEKKRFVMKPMSMDEALLQLELSGHAFFLFRNDRSNLTELVYKREGGGYGLLSPEM